MPGGHLQSGHTPGDDVARGIAEMFRHAPTDMGTSMLADRDAGRPQEWDIRNGVIVRKARAHGIATPISDILVPLLTVFAAFSPTCAATPMNASLRASYRQVTEER
jgi:ketopantoate reductase